jgi:hypothetical protein
VFCIFPLKLFLEGTENAVTFGHAIQIPIPVPLPTESAKFLQSTREPHPIAGTDQSILSSACVVLFDPLLIPATM